MRFEISNWRDDLTVGTNCVDSEENLLVWHDLALIREAVCGFEVAPFEARWHGPHTLKPFWNERRVVGTILAATSDLDARRILRAAAARRRRSFRKCSSCGNLTPPEHRTGSVCHSCMEAQGTVF